MDTMKLYQVTALDRLEELRAWVMNPGNRSHLIEESGIYKITVNDALGLPPITPTFESKFAGAVDLLAWPK